MEFAPPQKEPLTVQAAVNRIVRVAVGTFGSAFAYAYQDVYYATEWPPRRDAEALWQRGRNYHLYGRAAAAERAYRQLLTRFPHDERVEDAQFYLAVLLHETGRFTESLAQLDALDRRVPLPKWQPLIPYYAGKNYEAMGDIPQAMISYEQVAGNLDIDGPWRLARLRGLGPSGGVAGR